MAEASTVVSHEAPITANGTLFRGKHFWLSHNVPQRNRFKELIEQHGGHIRLFEKDAEIKIVDHKRRNLPPDTYSFKFIEDSIRKGRMQNLEPYRAGPSEARPVGASYIPTRNHKVPYTVADDQFLWDWMQKYERDSTASISGNKIYQELAAKVPQNGADPVPIPPEIDPLFLQLPFLPSSPEPEPVPDPQPEIPEQDIDTWIDRRLRNGRATEAQIIEALRCTSMDPDLADKVLEFMVAGKDIPDDIPGVWTCGDDRCVEGKETRGIQRVLEKHGAEAFDARWEYLSMARAAGLETETIE
ncbi:hypothetical protein BO99DRAFT_345443 [Aspergillus violaceofuscus CBS 115571]|uniref:DNA-binding protein RAP1 n=1 Tax=Aspergillus violaceofuscus (strain CBS 115571) TaxID=1450538 RepID=A0A2V5H0L6_ASPV1|nr:hypothetical protein BO99DRAFT_345443 [Aspergillus violaceofuscus CBS 115571]